MLNPAEEQSRKKYDDWVNKTSVEYDNKLETKEKQLQEYKLKLEKNDVKNIR
mgnify:CR=1 FL=1